MFSWFFSFLASLTMNCNTATCAFTNVLIVGDSEAGATATQLHQVKRPNEHVSLDYKVGSTIQFWAAGKFQKSMKNHPDTDEVIIFLGTNNYGNSTLPDVTPILNEIKARHVKCTWVGPTSVHGKHWPINSMLKAAVSNTCTYVDTESLGIDLHDGVHPTPSGALKWIRYIWSVK